MPSSPHGGRSGILLSLLTVGGVVVRERSSPPPPPLRTERNWSPKKVTMGCPVAIASAFACAAVWCGLPPFVPSTNRKAKRPMATTRWRLLRKIMQKQQQQLSCVATLWSWHQVVADDVGRVVLVGRRSLLPLTVAVLVVSGAGESSGRSI